MNVEEFKKDLSCLLNTHSVENNSNTPDFLLSDFMVSCLHAFEEASLCREGWFGVHLDILKDWESLVMHALGQASVCWSDYDKAGEFDSTRCAEIGKKLLEDLKSKIVEPRPTEPFNDGMTESHKGLTATVN